MTELEYGPHGPQDMTLASIGEKPDQADWSLVPHAQLEAREECAPGRRSRQAQRHTEQEATFRHQRDPGPAGGRDPLRQYGTRHRLTGRRSDRRRLGLLTRYRGRPRGWRRWLSRRPSGDWTSSASAAGRTSRLDRSLLRVGRTVGDLLVGDVLGGLGQLAGERPMLRSWTCGRSRRDAAAGRPRSRRHRAPCGEASLSPAAVVNGGGRGESPLRPGRAMYRAHPAGSSSPGRPGRPWRTGPRRRNRRWTWAGAPPSGSPP